MAKVSKSLLKEIVKECLVEILAEGLTGGDANQLSESVENVRSKKMPRSIQKMMPPKKKINENFESNIQETIRQTTQDPVMAEILADTAKTTLQEQISAEGAGHKPLGNDSASRAVANNNLEDLFGESSNNWANLAFSDAKSK